MHQSTMENVLQEMQHTLLTLFKIIQLVSNFYLNRTGCKTSAFKGVMNLNMHSNHKSFRAAINKSNCRSIAAVWTHVTALFLSYISSRLPLSNYILFKNRFFSPLLTSPSKRHEAQNEKRFMCFFVK